MWAVVTLGPNWRIRQDPNDQTVFFVSRRPFRFMRHPIYVGLIIISAGQLLTGFEGRAFLLIVASVVHLVVQAHTESRYWKTRS